MYSYRVEQAIRAAAVLHKGQVRRGDIPLPYITHLFAAMLIVADYTDNEDILVATLLHDTLEDTDYTSAELAEDFGAEIVAIVEAVSEPDASLNDWNARKKQYLKQIKKAGEAALLVCAADKIHNLRTATEQYFTDHVSFINDFGGSLDERMLYFQKISNILNAQLKNDIVHEFNHVFTEYKNFIEDVKRTQEKARV